MKRIRRAWSQAVGRIADLADSVARLDDADLRRESLSLRFRAQAGEPFESLLPRAYALAREAGHRALGMRHYDVQLAGGVALFHRSVAEMQTGEGKTLTATLPLCLAALAGRGAHLATSNDYLARRDAEWMAPLYRLMGLSVASVQNETPPTQRRLAYHSDITYGTAKEFGFDFLRDRLHTRYAEAAGSGGPASQLLALDRAEANHVVQREPFFALVDEADSTFIDEARTPLVISSAPGKLAQTQAEIYLWAAEQCQRFEQNEHFRYLAERKAVELTLAGRRLVRRLRRPPAAAHASQATLEEFIGRAIKVARDYRRDKHYLVRDDEVVIIDEQTGRTAEGRRWRGGIHQAIEAREGVPISLETGHAARITVQDYFLRYPRLAGMTGTAAGAAGELRRIYSLSVTRVPTNRPPRREQWATRIVPTATEKHAAVVEEIVEVHKMGRPILVGARSVEQAEQISTLLEKACIYHQVLSARHHAAEAEIVAQAGQRGKVTVATNMAGRGTDIRLDEDSLRLGGLHVICTEMHESARIDRQLIGRCGRQGDPGSYRFFLSLEDSLLAEAFGPQRAAAIRQARRGSLAAYQERLERLFEAAQRRLERRYARQRQELLERERQRNEMLEALGLDPHLDGAAA